MAIIENKLEIGGNTIIGIERETVSGYGDYVKFSDGTMIQWGFATGDAITADGRTIKQVGFPTSFVDAEFVVTVTQFGGYTFGGGIYANISVQNTNKNAFTIFFTQGNALTPKFCWIAIGRWK